MNQILMKPLFITAAAMTLAGCSGTSTGNPNPTQGGSQGPVVTLRFSAASHPGSAPGSPQPSASPSVFPSGLPSVLPAISPTPLPNEVSDVLFCYARIAFTSESGLKTSLPYAVGAVGFGTTLGTVPLSPGSYTRIELFLTSACPSGESVQFTGHLGPMATTDDVTLTFNVSFTQTNSNSIITLDSDGYADALTAVALPSQIQAALEAVAGVAESVQMADGRNFIRRVLDFGNHLLAREPQGSNSGRSPASSKSR